MLKKCRQCGEIKSIDQYRPYYTGKGTYTICKTCEKINSRAKYLKRKGDKATQVEVDELKAIYELYDMQRMCGLKPPNMRTSDEPKLIDVINKYKQDYLNKADSGPDELEYWLTAPLTDVPEYYLDTVYEDLKAKYRPVKGVDSKTLLPIHDETHTDLLNQILERFNNYEDTYYTEAD